MLIRPLLAFYGDDFTGSTDALESLALAGLRTVLFLRPPAKVLLETRFRNLQCLGIAGTSRSMSPTQMRTELEWVLRELQLSGAPLIHYKVCSTFDSSPDVGSIGYVIDMAREALPASRFVSILAGVPALGRYTVFGNHFAAADGVVYRLDRHPTMSRHPVTPMHEADLRLHLARQTCARVGLMSLVDLQKSGIELARRFEENLQTRPEALLFDMAGDEHLAKIGGLLWEEAKRGQHFVVGSSGVGYALAAHWRQSGLLSSVTPVPASAEPRAQVLAVSGSCSPITARQIEHASRGAFDCIAAPAEQLVDPARAERARRALFDQAVASLARGRSPLVYSASGPEDPSIGRTRERVSEASETGHLIGRQLGRLVRELVNASTIRRVVIAGGDTSSYATQELGLYALELLAPAAPGAPLCRTYSDDPRFDGLEIALKGGQMGQPDYFDRMRSGALR